MQARDKQCWAMKQKLNTVVTLNYEVVLVFPLASSVFTVVKNFCSTMTETCANYNEQQPACDKLSAIVNESTA